MAAAKVLVIIRSILYELQPFRLVDVVDLVKYIIRSTRDLSAVSLIASDFFYKNIYEFVGTIRLRTWGLLLAWTTGWALMVYAGFGSLWILLSMFASIFLNLGKRKKGEMSAYSVFNEGFKQLLGTLNAEQFDEEIRHNNTDRRGAHRDIVQLDDVLRGQEAEDEWLADLNQRHLRRRRGAGAQDAARDIGNATRDDAADEDNEAPRRQRARKKGKGKKASRRTREERTNRRGQAQELEPDGERAEEEAVGEESEDENMEAENIGGEVEARPDNAAGAGGADDFDVVTEGATP